MYANQYNMEALVKCKKIIAEVASKAGTHTIYPHYIPTRYTHIIYPHHIHTIYPHYIPTPYTHTIYPHHIPNSHPHRIPTPYIRTTGRLKVGKIHALLARHGPSTWTPALGRVTGQTRRRPQQEVGGAKIVPHAPYQVNPQVLRDGRFACGDRRGILCKGGQGRSDRPNHHLAVEVTPGPNAGADASRALSTAQRYRLAVGLRLCRLRRVLQTTPRTRRHDGDHGGVDVFAPAPSPQQTSRELPHHDGEVCQQGIPHYVYRDHILLGPRG